MLLIVSGFRAYYEINERMKRRRRLVRSTRKPFYAIILLAALLLPNTALAVDEVTICKNLRHNTYAMLYFVVTALALGIGGILIMWLLGSMLNLHGGLSNPVIALLAAIILVILAVGTASIITDVIQISGGSYGSQTCTLNLNNLRNNMFGKIIYDILNLNALGS